MKFYLSLIITLFTLLNLNAQIFNTCFPIHVIIDKVEPNSSCSAPDGKIEVHASGLNAPFLYEWEHEGKVVSTSRKLTGLYGGDYLLTVRSAQIRTWSTKRRVLVHGIVCDQSRSAACKESLSPPEVTGVTVKFVEDEYGIKEYELYVGLTDGSGSLDAMFREKTDSELKRGNIWIDVPKPGSIFSMDKFKIGKTYEFVAVDNWVSFDGEDQKVGHISKPFIYIHSPHESALKSNKSLKNSNFTIFPQPANEYLNIKSPSDFKSNSIEILNVNGELIREIYSSSFENFKLNVSDLDNGLYFLRISSETKKWIEKVLIQ